MVRGDMFFGRLNYIQTNSMFGNAWCWVAKGYGLCFRV